MTEKKQVKVYLPPELHERLNVDPRSNSQTVEDALKTEFQTGKNAAVKRRINEIERRMSQVKSERQERDVELEELSDRRKQLEKQLEASEDIEQAKQDAIDERLEALQDVRGAVDESHPTVEALA